MGDLNRDVLEEVQEERVTQEGAQPAQPLDSTTLLVKRIVTIRNTAEATNLKDTNQALDQVLPD
jgi:hypothetical protein